MSEVLAAKPATMVPVKEEHVPAEGVLRIFKCRRAHMQYIFRDGTIAVFAPRTNEAAGHYLTKDPVKIAELEEIIKGHPHLYKDEQEFEVEEKLADPAVAARAKIAEETKQQFAAALQNPELLKAAGIAPEAMKKLLEAGRDFGSTDSKPELQGIATSANVGAAMGESNGLAAAQVPQVPTTIKKVS